MEGPDWRTKKGKCLVMKNFLKSTAVQRSHNSAGCPVNTYTTFQYCPSVTLHPPSTVKTCPVVKREKSDIK